MIKDIPNPKVSDVVMAVAKEGQDEWKVYLINRSKDVLHTVLVNSRGYGEKDGTEQKTSTLRHMIPHLEAGEYGLVEPLDSSVFHLNNEYWLSYFIDKQLFDKKYIFLPDSVKEDNLLYIKELDKMGILHL